MDMVLQEGSHAVTNGVTQQAQDIDNIRCHTYA